MEERENGWFVKNVRDARWLESDDFGRRALLEPEGERFPQVGVNIAVLEPGKPACLYHRESAQEDFLVLSGRCKLLIAGEERALGAWDFVHCPPGVSHVFIGDGDGPCAILMIGARPEAHALFYPKNELAARYGAETPEDTPDPRVAYGSRRARRPIDPPEWPIR